MKSNEETALLLDEIGDLLEVDGANPFRVRAYRNAARTIRELEKPIPDVDLRKLKGIGADLAGKIAELHMSGTTPVLEEAREAWPEGVRALLKVQGLGPKRTKILVVELGIKDVADLKRAVDAGLVKSTPGLGASLEKKLKETLSLALPTGTAAGGRFPLDVARPIADDMVARIRALPGVTQAEAAGSLRRGKSTVGDVDIVVCAPDFDKHGAAIIEAFTKMPRVREVLGAGGTRGSVKLDNGLQVDLRVVDEDSYGAALLYLTGSKGHSIELRAAAIKLGLKLNEYGVWKGETRVAGKTEQAMYDALGMKFLTPAQRER